jgi:hypothetical protein
MSGIPSPPSLFLTKATGIRPEIQANHDHAHEENSASDIQIIPRLRRRFVRPPRAKVFHRPDPVNQIRRRGRHDEDLRECESRHNVVAPRELVREMEDCSEEREHEAGVIALNACDLEAFGDVE